MTDLNQRRLAGTQPTALVLRANWTPGGIWLSVWTGDDLRWTHGKEADVFEECSTEEAVAIVAAVIDAAGWAD